MEGRRLVCSDATLLAPAPRACHRTRHLAAPSQRALGQYLPGNEVMLHVSVGPESERERQMLFDQLDLLRAGDVLVLDREWAAALGRALIRHVQGRSQPRNHSRHKPHPSQSYKLVSYCSGPVNFKFFISDPLCVIDLYLNCDFKKPNL